LYKTTGIIIKRRNYAEADRILTIFTPTTGKILVKAKGVRKLTSKRASHIELLNRVNVSLYKKGNIPILTEVISITSFDKVKQNLSLVGFAYHICELVDSLCPEGQENSEVFSLLEQMLFDLSEKNDVGKNIHNFEIKLLTILGFLQGNENLEGAKASYFIESILERRLKVRQILPLLI